MSASQPALPSVSSLCERRRATSLSNTEQASAAARWEATLRERLGTPGQPPGRDVLPSLYDGSRRTQRPGASAMVPASGQSRCSAPPSTLGPSASIVAWFAQFQCEKCQKIPMSLEARFCCSCGEPLPLPAVPGKRTPQNLADVAAAAADTVKHETTMAGDCDGHGKSRRQVARGTRGMASMERGAGAGLEDGQGQGAQRRGPGRQQRGQPDAHRQQLLQKASSLQATSGRRGARRTIGDSGRRSAKPVGGGRALSPLIEDHHDSRSACAAQKANSVPACVARASSDNAAQAPLPWGQRESQVAVWLGSIKPRKP